MKHSLFYLLSLLMFFGLSLNSCQKESPHSENASPTSTTEEADPLKQVPLLTPQDETIDTSLAWKTEDLLRGLSGVRADEFDIDDAKLFFYLREESRTFWMPETFFDLDIFYLNEDLEIIEIVRDLPHHPSREEPIPRAPAVISRYVLEMRSDSPIARGLRVGDSLRWNSPLSLQQTELRIRQQQ